jgi:outer membrane autotransporter protein
MKRTNSPHAPGLLAKPYLGTCAIPTLLAAMLALSIPRAGAQGTLNVTQDQTISTPMSIEDLHIRDGATLTVTGPNGSLTGSPNPVWQIGDIDGTTGTLNIEGGGTATLEAKAELRLGQAADSTGVLLISDPGSRAEINGTLTIGFNPTPHGGTGRVTVENGGELAVQQIQSVSGLATLTLNAGTLTALVSNNDFITGIPTVLLGQGGGIINTNGNNVIINSSFSDAPLGGPVTGPGNLVKDGEGTLTLNTASTFTGGMFMREGTLIAGVPNALGNGDVFLQGGTIATRSFVPSGPSPTFPAPTGVTSTINVAGNYVQTGGVLALGLAGTAQTQYDHVLVGGTIAAGGTLFVQPLGTFVPEAGNAFALLQHTTPNPSERTVSGFFSEVDEPALVSHLRPVLIYARNAVLLIYLQTTQQIGPTPSRETEEIEQQEPQPPLAPLPKQPLQPAAPVQPPVPQPTPVPTPVPTPTPPVDGGGPVPVPSPTPTPGKPQTPQQKEELAEEQRVLQLVSDQVLPPLDPSQPVPQSFLVRLFDPTVEELTSLYQAGFSSADIQNSILNDHMSQIQRAYVPPPPAPVPPPITKGTEGKEIAPPPPPAPSTPCWSLWGSAYGNWVHIDTTSAALGYNFTTAGMAAGIDYLITPHLLVGAFGGYSHDWINFNPSGSADADEGHGGIYASYWDPTGWYINSAVYGGGASYSTNRQAAFGPASGSSSGYQFSTFGEGGYSFHALDSNLVWGPFVGMSYSQVHVNGFDEHGSVVPLDIHSDTFESLETAVGAQAYWTLHAGKFLITPGLKLDWGHEYKYSVLTIHASAPALGGAQAVFPAPNIGHDWLSIEAGVGVQITPRISAIINYVGQLAREHSSSNAVTGTFSFSF